MAAPPLRCVTAIAHGPTTDQVPPAVPGADPAKGGPGCQDHLSLRYRDRSGPGWCVFRIPGYRGKAPACIALCGVRPVTLTALARPAATHRQSQWRILAVLLTARRDWTARTRVERGAAYKGVWERYAGVLITTVRGSRST
jgi:hypothetical protein